MKKMIALAASVLWLYGSQTQAAIYNITATNANAPGSDFVLAGVNKNLVFDLTGTWDSDTGAGSFSGTASSTNGGNAFPLTLNNWSFTMPADGAGGTIGAWDASNCAQANNPAAAVCTSLGANVGGSLDSDTNPVSTIDPQQWQLASAALSGTLQVELSQVPLPAAAWLFGSALLGLVSIQRRTAHAGA